MDAKYDILNNTKVNPSSDKIAPTSEQEAKISLGPEQETKLKRPLPAPTSPFQTLTNVSTKEGTGQNETKQFPSQRISNLDMFLKLNKNPTLSPEEEAKEKKRERSRRIIAAVGDGISALSNLYFSTKGAPNMYNPNNSLSAAYKKRHDDAIAKRDAQRDRWMAGYTNAVQMDDNVNWRDKIQNYREGRDRLSDKRYEEERKAASTAADLKYQRDVTLQKINHAFQIGVLDVKSKQELDKQAIGAKNQKDLLALGHKYKLEEIAAGKKEVTKKTEKKNGKLPKLHLEGPNGETQYYDMNDDVQVAKLYNEGLRAGYFKEAEGKQATVKQMRDAIIGSTGRWKEGNSGGLNAGGDSGWSLNEGKDNGGWSLK